MSNYTKYLQRITKRQNEPSTSIARSILMGLGGLVAIGAGLYLLGYFAAVLFFVLKAALVAGVIGGAGYLGYRALTRQKMLPRGRSRDESETSRKYLPPSDIDYERKMRELEAIERRLDAEISKHS